MLNTISISRNRAVPVTDAVGDLLACHTRIRYFVAMAQRLVDAPAGARMGEIAETAGAVARYFTVALPLHADDEDLSLRPRLEAVATARDVRAELHKMSSEHESVHEIINEVAPLWHAVALDPSRLRPHRRQLAIAAAELDAFFQRHLPPEEDVIFPALRRYLNPAQLSEIRGEMRARRTV